jgi:hypothetical protein
MRNNCWTYSTPASKREGIKAGERGAPIAGGGEEQDKGGADHNGVEPVPDLRAYKKCKI